MPRRRSSPIRSWTPRRSARSRWRWRRWAPRAAPNRSPGWWCRRCRSASVLAVGLGKPRDEWPADVIRRAAGVAARSLTGTETVITTLSELRPGGGRRGSDPGRLPVHRLPQRQDRAQGSRPAQDHRAVHGEGRQEAGRARDRDRHRGGHRARLRQHPAEPPVPRRIRQARQGFRRGGRPAGRGARREGAGEGRLRRHRRRRQGLVAAAAAGAADAPAPASEERARRSRWSARASPSTPAASRSSRPRRCTT